MLSHTNWFPSDNDVTLQHNLFNRSCSSESEPSTSAERGSRVDQVDISTECSSEPTNGSAVDRFSSSKGISSDMYFNRDGKTAEEREEISQRLGKFSNAQSISSDAYFGRAPISKDNGKSSKT